MLARKIACAPPDLSCTSWVVTSEAPGFIGWATTLSPLPGALCWTAASCAVPDASVVYSTPIVVRCAALIAASIGATTALSTADTWKTSVPAFGNRTGSTDTPITFESCGMAPWVDGSAPPRSTTCESTVDSCRAQAAPPVGVLCVSQYCRRSWWPATPPARLVWSTKNPSPPCSAWPPFEPAPVRSVIAPSTQEGPDGLAAGVPDEPWPPPHAEATSARAHSDPRSGKLLISFLQSCPGAAGVPGRRARPARAGSARPGPW